MGLVNRAVNPIRGIFGWGAWRAPGFPGNPMANYGTRAGVGLTAGLRGFGMTGNFPTRAGLYTARTANWLGGADLAGQGWKRAGAIAARGGTAGAVADFLNPFGFGSIFD